MSTEKSREDELRTGEPTGRRAAADEVWFCKLHDIFLRRICSAAGLVATSGSTKNSCMNPQVVFEDKDLVREEWRSPAYIYSFGSLVPHLQVSSLTLMWGV